MAAVQLIRARSGVYGRQATDEERELLKRFARDYVASTSTHSAADVAALRRLAAQMLSDPLIGDTGQGTRSKDEGRTKARVGDSAKGRAGSGSPRKTRAAVKTSKPAAKRAAKSATKSRAKG